MLSKHLPRLITLVWLGTAMLPGATNTTAAPTGLIRATKTLYAFQWPPNRPSSLLLGGDGNFYGVSAGGAFGFLFKVTPNGAFSIVHDFKDDGAGNPISLSLGKDGNLYGILSSNGAIFKCSLTGTFSVLANPGSAAHPGWLISGSDGNLYGTTRSGGTANQGSVFRLSPGEQLTTIYSFTGGTGGSDPNELIEGGAGIFYGICGPSSSRFFKVTSSGVFNIVRDLSGTFDSGPAHLVYGDDGNIYGSDIHSYQSPQPGNSLFRLTPNGDLTPVYNFGSAAVTAIMKGGDGNLYCSTTGGIYNVGAISRVTLSGQVTTLYSFTNKDDGFNPGALSFVPGQGLFGVTQDGSAGDGGTVFHLNQSNQFTTLVRLGATGKGYSPKQALLQASDGSFFGTTNLGGSGGYGTVYHLKSSGEFVTLHEFGGDTGAYPSRLIMAEDGRLYGASLGLNEKGSVYRIDATGAFTLLHEFTDGDDGSHPTALVASRDGNIYGVATSSQNGGKYGSFFRITPAGTFNVVKVFDNSGNGAYPVGLVEAKDGSLYGLVSGFYGGSLFRITSAGVKTDIYTFAPDYGSQPANLIAGSDGNLYGTRSGYIEPSHGGLLLASGAIWQCSPGGTFKILHSFNNSDGIFYPWSLLAASDGNFYGLVGVSSGGLKTIVYRLTTAGAFTPLYESQFLVQGLLEGFDGNFYGTTPFGGPLNGGTVLQYVFGAPSAVNLATRMKVGTGDNVSIGGFIITGNAAKKVMLRGIGPSLAVNGQPLAGKLDDPMLELHDASGTIIGRNDNWRTSQPGGVVTGDQSSQIKASGLAPMDDRESALIASLQPGSYTAVVSGAQNATGVGLVEIYDLDIEADSKLANISTRGFADTGDNALIGGFIVDGSFYSRSKIVVRALGPSLAPFGIPNLLKDPFLSIYDQNGNGVAVNGDWQNANQPEVISAGLAPKDAHEAAIYMVLVAGNYTAVVSGEDGGTGVALVETYNLP
jgi:uncharacterized repeat protein (TIGR03803 family)